MLLAHHAFLLIGFHDAALRAEVTQLSVEYLILAELTLQRTIIKRSLERGFQSYLLKTFLAVAQHPCVVVEELVLKSLANHLVCSQEVRSGDALAVWRISHDDALLCRLGEILEVSLSHGDVLAQSGCLHVHKCSVHRLHVNVISIYMMSELALL